MSMSTGVSFVTALQTTAPPSRIRCWPAPYSIRGQALSMSNGERVHPPMVRPAHHERGQGTGSPRAGAGDRLTTSGGGGPAHHERGQGTGSPRAGAGDRLTTSGGRGPAHHERGRDRPAHRVRRERCRPAHRVRRERDRRPPRAAGAGQTATACGGGGTGGRRVRRGGAAAAACGGGGTGGRRVRRERDRRPPRLVDLRTAR